MSLNSLSVFTKMAAGFISIKVLAVLLGPSALALLGNFKDVKNAVKSFATLGVQSGVVKYVAESENNKQERSVVLSTAFFMILFSSVFLGLISIFFSKSIGQYLFKTSDYQICVIAFGALLPFYGFHVFSMSIINGLKKFKALVILSIISSVFALIITILLIWYYKVLGALLGLAVVESIIFVFYLMFFMKRRLVLNELKWSLVSSKYAINLSSYSAMTFVSVLIVPFSMLFIRNLIIKIYNINDAGLWDAVGRLSNYYLMILLSGINMYYLPKLASIKTNNEFKREIKTYFKSFVPLCLVLLVVIFLLRHYIVSFTLSDDFYEVNNLLIYQLIGDFFKIASYAFAQQFLAKKLTFNYIATEVLFYVIYLITVVLLMPEYGIKGVVLSYLISYIAYFLMMIFCFREVLFERNNNE